MNNRTGSTTKKSRLRFQADLNPDDLKEFDAALTFLGITPSKTDANRKPGQEMMRMVRFINTLKKFSNPNTGTITVVDPNDRSRTLELIVI
jgi:hypothetical protein